MKRKYKIWLFIGLIIFLFVMILISPFLVYQRVYDHVSSTKWDPILLTIALFALLFTTWINLDKRTRYRKFRRVARFGMIVLFIFVYSQYGFINGAFFMSAFYLIRLLLLKTLPHMRGGKISYSS